MDNTLFAAGYPSYPTPSSSGYPTPYPAVQPYPSSAGATTSGYPPYPSAGSGYPPYPVSASGAGSNTSGYPTYPPAHQPVLQSTGSISEDHIRASLLSAVEDKVPLSFTRFVVFRDSWSFVLRFSFPTILWSRFRPVLIGYLRPSSFVQFSFATVNRFYLVEHKGSRRYTKIG